MIWHPPSCPNSVQKYRSTETKICTGTATHHHVLVGCWSAGGCKELAGGDVGYDDGAVGGGGEVGHAAVLVVVVLRYMEQYNGGSSTIACSTNRLYNRCCTFSCCVTSRSASSGSTTALGGLGACDQKVQGGTKSCDANAKPPRKMQKHRRKRIDKIGAPQGSEVA